MNDGRGDLVPGSQAARLAGQHLFDIVLDQPFFGLVIFHHVILPDSA
jgi:hypothetical protein